MFELRPYQQAAHEATIAHCKESKEPAFHSQSVGAGKTISIAYYTKYLTDRKARVLVLARQGELISQNSDDYKMIGGKCSIYSSSLGMKSTFYPAVFGTEGTVGRALDTDFAYNEKEPKKSPGFYHAVLIDECHMVDWQDVISDEPSTQYGKIVKHLITINPNIRVIGYTGSPYRSNASIKGAFWKKQLSDVSTYQLINEGYLVPPVFGFADEEHHYNGLDKFTPNESESADDFSAKELAAMGREICKQKDKTQLIMEEVIERTRNRLGVLITCASKKHCEQVAECLPIGTWGIVTDSTGSKDRKQILDDAKSGKIKYVIQIGCLTTGVNVTRWDALVFLRKIGSLVQLIQLSGRGLRILKDEQMAQGMEKHDCLMLDYTDTFEAMGKIFDDPIVQNAMAAKTDKEFETQECPKCATENSEFAVRCRGLDSSATDGRCEHYFKFTMCLACETENAPTARTCRNCDAILIDPNEALTRKAYTDAEYKPVVNMRLSQSSNGGITVTYNLESTYHKDGIEKPEAAKEYFQPESKEQFQKARWWKFIATHIQGNMFRRTYAKMTIDACIKNQSMLDVPTHITHRVNDKGFSIINRKKFRSGREEKAS